MAPKQGFQKIKLRVDGKYNPPKQDPKNDRDEDPSIPEQERTRRLRWRPRGKLISMPKLSKTATRKVLSEPKPPQNPETSRAYYESAFPGWVASPLPMCFPARHLLQEALIPSPLADEYAWSNAKTESEAAWIGVIGHSSGQIQALFEYCREKRADIDDFIFGMEKEGKEFPSRSRMGFLCDLTQNNNSANQETFVDSRASEDHPLSELRIRRIPGDYVLPLNPEAASGQSQEAAEGRPPSSAITSLELRRLRLSEEDRYGFFIINSTLAPLVVNGISVGKNMVAGPLPDFAVIGAEDVVFFWWCTLQGVNFIPKELPTSSQRGSSYPKRPLEEREGYENFNDQVPPAKRPKYDEDLSSRHKMPTKLGDAYLGKHVGTATSLNRFPQRNRDHIKDTKASKVGDQNETAGFGDQFAPQPDGDEQGNNAKNSALVSQWRIDYRHRMDACNVRAKKADGKKGTRHRLTHSDSLIEDDVFLPIAAVWYGLVKQDIRFAFGTKCLFEVAQSDEGHGMACVLSPNSFLMPLISSAGLPDLTGEAFESVGAKSTKITPNNKNGKEEKSKLKFKTRLEADLASKGKNSLPYSILVIAERGDAIGKGVPVFLTFMDSRSNETKRNNYRQAARNVVRNSLWMEEEQIWSDENWPAVARQGNKSKTPFASGIHVVLNAWAYMLNIPLANDVRMKPDFYAEARKIIRVALKGCLDSRTIRSFMQAYEYAVPQDLAAIRQSEEEGYNTIDGLRHMQSMYMNEQIFSEIINGIHKEEQGGPPGGGDNSPREGGGASYGPGDDAPGGHPSRPKNDPPRPAGNSPGLRESPPGQGIDLPPSEKSLSPPKRDLSGPGQDPSGSGGDPQSWNTILNNGLPHFSKLYEQETRDTRELFTRIESAQAIEDDPVCIAIASLWAGLRRAGTIFSFGTANTFEVNRSAESSGMFSGETVVFSQYPLVIPLYMPANEHIGPPFPKAKLQSAWKIKEERYRQDRIKKLEKTKGKGKGPKDRSNWANGIGHFVLAIAERRENKQIQITISNSGPRYARNGDLANAARTLVVYSGWLGINVNGNRLRVAPDFAPVAFPKVPLQRYGNTCGLYVILNAWAYMLGIPIRQERERHRNYPHTQFHKIALQIINLALAGFMDSLTIQAFLNVWGYAVEQDMNDPNARVAGAQTVRMDEMILRTLVEDQRVIEQIQASGSAPTEEQITQLTDMGFPRERVIQQLTLTGGNSEMAVTGLSSRPIVAYTPQDDDIGFLMALGGFSRERVIQELVRTTGNCNGAYHNLLSFGETASPPTKPGTKSSPPRAGSENAPPGTGLEHPYDEETIAMLMTDRDISPETVIKELNRAEGDIEKARETIRHLSQSLGSPGSAHSLHGEGADPGTSRSCSKAHSGQGPDSLPSKRKSHYRSHDNQGTHSKSSKSDPSSHSDGGTKSTQPKRKRRPPSRSNEAAGPWLPKLKRPSHAHNSKDAGPGPSKRRGTPHVDLSEDDDTGPSKRNTRSHTHARQEPPPRHWSSFPHPHPGKPDQSKPSRRPPNPWSTLAPDPSASESDINRPYTDWDVKKKLDIKKWSDDQTKKEVGKFSLDVNKTIMDLTGDPTHVSGAENPIGIEDQSGDAETPEDVEDSELDNDSLFNDDNISEDFQTSAADHGLRRLRRVKSFPEEDIRTLTCIGYTSQAAVFALSVSGGDLEEAMKELRRQKTGSGG